MCRVWGVGIYRGCLYVFLIFFLCIACFLPIETTISLKKPPQKMPAAAAWEPGSGKHTVNFTKSSQKYWKIHKILTCAKKRTPTKYCSGSQIEENAFAKMHGIHGAADSGVTLFSNPPPSLWFPPSASCPTPPHIWTPPPDLVFPTLRLVCGMSFFQR